ncbi:helix-turn-helix transcriptional regulator [Streptomyces sp. NPDC059851]|uniref:helix-turn-helix domain-containing protein n=1 Tax=Streptomyces sp. NPDC059851 TaxID=3346971 RepID=UPI00365492C0
MSRDGGWAGRVRREALRAAASAHDVEGFFDDVAKVVFQAVPCDVWAGVTVDPTTLMNTGGNYRNGVPGALMPRMLDIEYREGDVNLLPDLVRRRTPVGLLSQEVGGELDASPRYRDIVKPLGCRDELRIVLRDRYGTWGALVLGRGVDAPPFEAADIAAAGALAEPLGEALRRLQLAERARVAESPTAPGLILLDPDYELVSASSTVRWWFEELESGSPGSRGLPPAVYAVAARVRAAQGPSSMGSWARTRSGGCVRLHAWLLQDGPRDDPMVAVSVEPADDGERAGFLIAAYGLTARERSVTELVLHGYSTAEISRRAHLSPHTVQDHLKAVFDKVGVRSRRDLVATIFSRHYRPGLLPSRVPPSSS